ncbi:hypothetical protein SMCF_1929 [Streptomyces coelicoflavus ZG0656]|nr:hypothetical protein SMCF_1929 [Streptomyces coelicoflavus ZG0656]MZE44953.1 tyrosine-type recombinase/integrase [Streptomyces sp. SID5477]
MSRAVQVADRWHRRTPATDDQQPCKCGTRERPYPSGDHGTEQRWAVRWRDAEGRQKKRLYARKPDAQRYAAEIKGDMDAGRYVDPGSGRTTFREVGERWRAVAAVDQRPSTRNNVERALRNHVYPAFGDREIASIRRSDIEQWVSGKAAELAPSSLETVYAVLRSVTGWATGEYLVTDPCAARTRATRIRLPRREHREIVPLSTVQLGALLEAAPDRYRCALLVAAGSGLRQGELFALEPEHVRPGEITVVQQVTVQSGERPVIAPPKSSSSRRTVPVPEALTEAVQRHLKAFPARVHRMPDTTGRKAGERDVRLLFGTASGTPVQRGPWSRAFGRTVRRANVLLAERGQSLIQAGTTLHDLRHLFASLLIRSGENVKIVQRRLGHASAAVTLEVYAHLFPDDDDTTRAAVQLHLGDLLG